MISTLTFLVWMLQAFHVAVPDQLLWLHAGSTTAQPAPCLVAPSSEEVDNGLPPQVEAHRDTLSLTTESTDQISNGF